MKRVIIVLFLMFVGGCTSYEKITDLNNGKVYYSTNVKQKKSGLVQFRDARTGNTVVLPSSQVEKITKDQYKVGIYSEQG